MDPALVQLGTSKVLYRAKEHNDMELKRNVSIEELCRTVQVFYRTFKVREMYKQMKKVKPILERAIKARDIKKLTDAIAQCSQINFEMKLMKDAKELKILVAKEIEITERIEKLLKEKDLGKIYDQMCQEL